MKSCHNHYCDNDSGVKASLQIKTLLHIFKRVDVKAMQWWAGTWADDDSDGGDDEEENRAAITTEWEWSCSSPEKKEKENKKEKQLRWEPCMGIFPLKS